MKLRCQANSVRLRLKRGEVAQLVKTGRIEERIVFGPGPGDALLYLLETVPGLAAPEASCRDGTICIRVPAALAARWAASDEVGMETMQTVGAEGRLQVLVEKDFACLNGPAEQNVDTFSNPLAETKC